MTFYDVIHDATGRPLASVCLTHPLTADERAVLVEYFTWMSQRHITKVYEITEPRNATPRDDAAGR